MGASQTGLKLQRNIFDFKELDEYLQSVKKAFAIKSNSPVIVYSSLARFQLDREGYRRILGTLTSAFHSNPIFLPTFTYSNRKGEAFQASTPPDPQCGALPRVAFEEQDSKFFRTNDADYSYTVLNNDFLSQDLKKTLERAGYASFGSMSHHSSILREDSTVIALGEGFRDGLTALMQAEAILEVTYREYVDLQNLSKLGGPNIVKYFARTQEFEGRKSNRTRIMPYLSTSGKALTLEHAQGGQTVSVQWGDLLNEAKLALERNGLFFYE